MSANDYAALTVAIMTIVGGGVASVRFLVKHYLSELKPNGGGSLSDRVTRVENRLDEIWKHLLER